MFKIRCIFSSKQKCGLFFHQCVSTHALETVGLVLHRADRKQKRVHVSPAALKSPMEINMYTCPKNAPKTWIILAYLTCLDLLLSIFGFLNVTWQMTKQAMWRCHLVLWEINFTYLTFNTFSAISSYFILVSGLQSQTIYYYYDAPSTTYHWFTYVDSWLHLAHKPLVSRGKFLFVNVSEMALEG